MVIQQFKPFFECCQGRHNLNPNTLRKLRSFSVSKINALFLKEKHLVITLDDVAFRGFESGGEVLSASTALGHTKNSRLYMILTLCVNCEMNKNLPAHFLT